MEDENYEILLPVIKSISYSKNPVAVSGKYEVTVVVAEELCTLTPVYPRAGQINAGQWPWPSTT